MKPVLVFQQVPHERLGSLEPMLLEAGCAPHYLELFRSVPDRFDLERAAGLVVLGGPMNVDQVQQYPYLEPQPEWIRRAMAAGLPVLGICLGAQLLAKALGARVYPGPQKEIGWYEIELSREAAGDRLFAGCGPRQTVFQWHGDTFDLPEGAVHLAGSTICPNQAFRVGQNAYGLQFHIEMTARMIDRWLDDPENRKELAGLDEIGPAAIRRRTPSALPQLEALGRRVLSRFAAMCKAAAVEA